MSFHLPFVQFNTLTSTPTPTPVTEKSFVRYDNVSLNAVGDYQMIGLPTTWLPHRFCVTRANGTISTAMIGLYSAPNGAGEVIAPPQIIKNVSDSSDYYDLEFTHIGRVQYIDNLYIRVTTPEGGKKVDVIITFDNLEETI